MLEKRSVLLLSKYLETRGNYTVELNNLNKKEDPDILVVSPNKNHYTVDVQYSQNFQKYGDLRIDLLSVAYIKNLKPYDPGYVEQEIKKIKPKNVNELFKIIENNMFVAKKGKLFLKSSMGEPYCNYLLYLLYDHSISDFRTGQPGRVMFIKTDLINSFLDSNLANLISQNRIRFNNKKVHGLEDPHASAFIAINLKKLQNYNETHYYTQLKKQGMRELTGLPLPKLPIEKMSLSKDKTKHNVDIEKGKTSW